MNNPADDLLHVTGAEIVPSSIYEVQLFDQAQESCGDQLEGMFSAPLTIPTARWGDVVAPFQAPSPCLDVADSRLAVGLLDVERHPRIVNCRPDMGAYEFAAEFGSCDPTIRVDSNNDGVINAADDLVANVSPGVIIYVNDDDDNFDDVPDLNEHPVADENDLAEVRLCADCYPLNPATAWWSISWTQPTSMAVWLAPDKSLGPIANGAHQPWPPPASAWVEALSPSAAATVADSAVNGFDITFQVSDNGLGALAANAVKATNDEAKRIKLRVVMLVEPQANLDVPPSPTFGCKLTKTQVKKIVSELTDYAEKNKLGKGIRFQRTTRDPIKLEATCMKVGLPTCRFSDQGTDNARMLSAEWYFANVVNKGGDTDVHLLGPGDTNHPQAYINEDCAYNVYFIGNMADDRTWGATLSQQFPAVPDSTLIVDGAGTVANAAENGALISMLMALQHEAGCHWLPLKGHACEVPGEERCDGQCPDNLCVNGDRLLECLFANKKNETIPGAYQTASENRMIPCGEQP
jgi:hypothetical protein